MTKNVPIHFILTKKVRALEEKQLAAGQEESSLQVAKLLLLIHQLCLHLFGSI